jgi:hypothetical protein
MTVSLDSRNGAKRSKTPESTTISLPLSAYVVRTRSEMVLGDRFAPTAADMRKTGLALRNRDRGRDRA